jgi:hypothetical protein
MKKLFTLFLSVLIMASALRTHAQQAYAGPTTQAYGKVTQADLDMTACDFEKDANSEVLFDKGSVYFSSYDLDFERHIRIKIFSDRGKDQANIRIEYFGGNQYEFLSGLQAETINSVNGSIQITKVDKKQIFTQSIDRARTAVSFAFPDVKPGSIIEYKYTISSPYLDDFPDWYFQTDIPTRYSEFSKTVPSEFYYKNLAMVNLPYVKNTDDFKAMANVPSLPDEPFMNSKKDNAQRILYELKSINSPGYTKGFSDTWNKVGDEVCEDDYFGAQFNKKLSGEEEIINKAKGMASQAEKIACVFGEVKDRMKWNDLDRWYTSDGTQDAWNKKTGNSTEINLIVCHLLQKSGVKALPMMVSTRKNGRANPAYPSKYQFNRTVTYVPVDSANYYILDATNKFNSFNETPAGILNTFGFWIDKDNKKYDLLFLQKPNAVRQLVLVNAEIKPDGKMMGTAQINSFSYNRLAAVEKYKTDGETKFIDYLQDGNNDLKISNVKFENMEVDTLPLTQSLDFNLALSGTDENYIYVNTNLFTGMRSNPFLNENRFTDIDFKYRDNLSINGVYKIPVGYKTDALPKSASMTMTDNSIAFKRLIAEQDGSIVVRYVIDYRKSIYFKENYPELHAFFKKMMEMLDEQIVLKKS